MSKLTQRQIDYREKFKDPRWQKLRLKVLERHGFACQNCGDTESTLHIHHRRYINGRDPWEYPLESLVTLCESCHETETELMSEACGVLLETIKENFFTAHIFELADGFHGIKIMCAPEVTVAILKWVMTDQEIMEELKARFFASLAGGRATNNG